MRYVFVILSLVVTACGGSVNPMDDASLGDAGSPDDADATGLVDVTIAPDGTNDVLAEAPTDVGVEAKAGPTSHPWGLDVGAGLANTLAVDQTNGHIAIGLYQNGSSFGYATIQCFDSSGSLLWQTSSQPGYIAGLAFDSAGALYAAVGSAQASTDFGGGPTGTGGVLVKFDSTGSFQWQYGAFSTTTFNKVAVKSSGNVVIAGSVGGSQDFGGGPISADGYGDVLLVEITNSKAYVRAKTWGGLGLQSAMTLALDSSDDIVMSGQFENSLDFGGGMMAGPSVGSGAWNIFIAKLDASGQYLHQTQLQTSGTSDGITDIALDSHDNVLVCGELGNQVNLSGKNFFSAGSSDVLIGKLDPSLDYVWGYRFGDGQLQTCEAIALDAQDDLVIAGHYQGGLNFGLGYLPWGSGIAAYVARISPSGTAKADVNGSFGIASFGIAGLRLLTPPDFVLTGGCLLSVNIGSYSFSCKANNGFESFLARFAPP